jgi:hypothetical protein
MMTGQTTKPQIIKVSESARETDDGLDVCHPGEKGTYSPAFPSPIYQASCDVTPCTACGKEHWMHTRRSDAPDDVLGTSPHTTPVHGDERPKRPIGPILDENGLSYFDKYKMGLLDIYCHGGEGEYEPESEIPTMKRSTGQDITRCLRCGREHWTHLRSPPGESGRCDGAHIEKGGTEKRDVPRRKRPTSEPTPTKRPQKRAKSGHGEGRNGKKKTGKKDGNPNQWLISLVRSHYQQHGKGISLEEIYELASQLTTIPSAKVKGLILTELVRLTSEGMLKFNAGVYTPL